ncbi:hypothetical protein PoB_004463100 [Plakobranchus ocellatus]|uniref:Uncharacterized protein n=1 Tax=Plakobranchus ocellatus TaxID=259542 RepID=A0AAV4BCJ0_9GAST|nr:hypothetical protein PoB_004463100 [Plakobranchus ocellatus]
MIADACDDNDANDDDDDVDAFDDDPNNDDDDYDIVMGGGLPDALGDTVDSESTLRSAVNLLSRVRPLPPAPWPDEGPESLRSSRCVLAYKKNSLMRYVMAREVLRF